MKKVLALLLAVLLLLTGLVACSPKETGGGGGNTPPSTDEGDNDEDEGEDETDTEKKTLLFQVDEGVGNYEFIGGCNGDREKIDLVLNNVYSGIKDLQANYDVAVLIYPTWYYQETGWDGKDPSEPMNKWKDDFLYAMDFFEEKDVGVYLEMMSSGIYTNQNGELGELPIVDINNGQEGAERREVKGISMDLVSMKALKEKYPETFRGVRFHELIGTDELGSNPPDDPYWGKHGYKIYEEDVYAIIDACAEAGLKLVWSDHSWDAMYDNATKSFWKQRVTYASDKLEKDLTVMWANNAGTAIRYLTLGLFENFKRDFPKSEIGLSNQNWFAIALEQNMGNDCQTDSPECDMPIELTAGFTLQAFNEGAQIVQYEPPYQFFNFHRSLYIIADLGIYNTLDGYTGSTAGYEYEPDYSPRVELKRLVELLNSKTEQFNNLTDFYDTSSSKIAANLVEDPPIVFTQSTIGTIGDNIHYYDMYNNHKGQWLNQDTNRFTERIVNKEVKKLSRIALNYNNFDDIVQWTVEDGKNVATFFNERSGLLHRDEEIFADNADGKFVTFAVSNLIQETIENMQKDTDEIIVAREKDGKINLSVYKAVNDGRYDASKQMSTKFKFTKVDSAIMYLNSFFGGTSIDAENFIGLEGIRTVNTIGKNSGKRPTEGLVAVYETQDGIRLDGKRYATALRMQEDIAIDGELSAFVFGDVDQDVNLADEFILAVEKDGKTEIQAYTFTDNFTLSKMNFSIDVGSEKVDRLFFLRKSYYQYDTKLD